MAVERRAADDDLLQIAAERGADIAEEKRAGVKPHVAHPVRGGKHCLDKTDLAALADLVPDLFFHRGEEERHKDERGRAETLDIPHDVAEGVVDRDLHAVVHARQRAGQLVGVVDGEHRQQAVVRAEVNGVARGVDRAAEIALGEHHALGGAGRARGEQQNGDAVEFGRGSRLKGKVGARGDDLVHRRVIGRVDGGRLHREKDDLGVARRHLAELALKEARENDDIRVGAHEEVFDLRRRQLLVERNGDAAADDRGEKGGVPCGRGLADDGDLFADEVFLVEPCEKGEDALGKTAVGEGMYVARAVKIVEEDFVAARAHQRKVMFEIGNTGKDTFSFFHRRCPFRIVFSRTPSGRTAGRRKRCG